MGDNKRRFLKRFVLSALFWIILLLILSFSILYFGTKQNEKRGVNNYNSFELNFEVYVINNLTSNINVERYFKESDKIWNRYNLSTKIVTINNLEISLSEREKEFLFNAMSSKEDNSSEICDKEYMPLIKKITNNSNLLGAIFIDKASSDYAGRGCICNCKFVILDVDKYLFLDFTGLNLAHEIGHLIGLIDINNGRQNLMNHNIIFQSFKSNFLNQTQINIIQNNSLFKKYNY